MEQKNSKIFSKETIQSVTAFCESQEIKDVNNFMYLCFKQGFDIKKYGFLGDEVTVEVIKEVEKIIEVPVDRIVEVIKEVEVIREVEILKEVEVSNNKEEMLQETLQVLKKELQIKNERIKELEKINRDLENINTPQQGATYLRGSNINNRL